MLRWDRYTKTAINALKADLLDLETALSSINIPKYVYLEKISDTQYSVYQKQIEGRWFAYLFNRFIDISVRKDLWGMSRVEACDLSAESPLFVHSRSNIAPVTIGGAWEHAMTAAGEEWMGSSAHGYEELQGFVIYVDDKPIPSILSGDVIKGENCGVAQKTNILLPSDSSIAAEAFTELRFTPDGLYIYDEITWKQELGINLFYASMCPYKRDPNISSKGRLFNEDAVQDMSTAGFPLVQKNACGGITWNDNNNLVMSVEILNPKEALNNYETNGTTKTWFTNSANPPYNKLYFTRVQGTEVQVTIGEVWRCVSKFNFSWRE